jgi:hypothetical protein
VKYELEDLKEGRILDFKNGIYGIISYQNPSKHGRTNELGCIYSNGEWDRVIDIIEKNFYLYESDYSLFAFINLIKDGISYCINGNFIKEV